MWTARRSAPVFARVGCRRCNTTPRWPAGSPTPTRVSTPTNSHHICSERGVDGLDQRSVAGALPSRNDVVHHIAEGHTCVGIGEAERATGAEVTKASRVGTERAVGPRWLEAEAERDVLAEHRAEPN